MIFLTSTVFLPEHPALHTTIRDRVAHLLYQHLIQLTQKSEKNMPGTGLLRASLQGMSELIPLCTNQHALDIFVNIITVRIRCTKSEMMYLAMDPTSPPQDIRSPRATNSTINIFLAPVRQEKSLIHLHSRPSSVLLAFATARTTTQGKGQWVVR